MRLKGKLLNILFVADVSISQIIGGAERVLYEHTTRLAARGHNVFILTRKLTNQNKNNVIIQGVMSYTGVKFHRLL